jgi:hypothetical protein
MGFVPSEDLDFTVASPHLLFLPQLVFEGLRLWDDRDGGQNGKGENHSMERKKTKKEKSPLLIWILVFFFTLSFFFVFHIKTSKCWEVVEWRDSKALTLDLN